MTRCAVLLLLGAFSATAQMRPPAVPLVAHDPYFSIWSMADRLNGDGTKHWTGKPNTLTAYARIDGKSYRIMGRDRQAGNELAQTRLEVLPTRTIYEFAGAGEFRSEEHTSELQSLTNLVCRLLLVQKRMQYGTVLQTGDMRVRVGKVAMWAGG